jgi:transcriptional regulator with XRE-family HTH domain
MRAAGLARSEWAELLGVSEASISNWLRDVNFPRPEYLVTILEEAEETDPPGGKALRDAALANFRELLGRPAIEVTPHGERVGPTLEHYMVRPLRDTFSALLAGLGPHAQRAVLYAATDYCACAGEYGVGYVDAYAKTAKGLAIFTAALSTLSAERQAHVMRRALALMDTSSQDGERVSSLQFDSVTREADTPSAPYAEDDGESEHTTDVQIASFGVLNPTLEDRVRVFASLPSAFALLNADEKVVPLLRPRRSRSDPLADRSPEFLIPDGRGALESQDHRQSVTAWWRLPDRSSDFAAFAAFPVEELLVYIHSGSVEWRSAGTSRSVSVGSGGEGRFLWMRERERGSGLPPFELRVTSAEPAIALVVMHARRGVPLRYEGTTAYFPPSQMKWTSADVARYWENARSRLRLVEDVPLLGWIPTDVSGIIRHFEDPLFLGPPRRYHTKAREALQFMDAAPRWGHALAGSAHPDAEARLDVSLLRYPRLPQGFLRGDLWMDTHLGHEVLVPLSSQLHTYFFLSTPMERHDGPEVRAGALLSQGRGMVEVEAGAGSPLGTSIPEVVLLDSSLVHAFTASDMAECYAMHIRIFDDKSDAGGAGGAPAHEEVVSPEARAIAGVRTPRSGRSQR